MAQGPPARGGISTFATTLVDDGALQELAEVRLLNTCRAAERAAGRWTAANAWHAVEDGWRTWRAARRADVVHVQTALLPALPLLRALVLCAAARLGGAAVLCHVHSGRANSGQAEAFSPSGLTARLLRLLRVADAVLTVSRAGATALQPFVPGTRVEAVDNAVPTERFAPAPLAGRPPVLLYVGTLSLRKGLVDLMAALQLLQDEPDAPAFRLEVVGGSHEVGEQEAGVVRDAVRAAGQSEALLGSLGAEQVQARLAAADVFVLPSHWEGQPIAILEAMASGLPVVVTSVGANPDVVRDGVDGLVVPSHDPAALAAALRTVLGDEGLRRRMGASARARAVERHDVSVLRARMADLYQEAAVLRGSRRSR